MLVIILTLKSLLVYRDKGDRGGKIVAIGTPEDLAKCNDSYLAKYLHSIFAIFS